jgi:hypothetical protein
MVLVKQVLKTDSKESDLGRIASDWMRQHKDLCNAWKNRTGKEVFLVRKFACAICSEKDTGLICVECIADIDKGEELEANKDVVAPELVNE